MYKTLKKSDIERKTKSITTETSRLQLQLSISGKITKTL